MPIHSLKSTQFVFFNKIDADLRALRWSCPSQQVICHSIGHRFSGLVLSEWRNTEQIFYREKKTHHKRSLAPKKKHTKPNQTRNNKINWRKYRFFWSYERNRCTVSFQLASNLHLSDRQCMCVCLFEHLSFVQRANENIYRKNKPKTKSMLET